MRKFPELRFRDVGLCRVGMPSVASVLLSTGTGGMEVSPLRPNTYIYTRFRTFSLLKKISRLSHACKISFSRLATLAITDEILTPLKQRNKELNRGPQALLRLCHTRLRKITECTSYVRQDQVHTHMKNIISENIITVLKS